MNSSKVECQVLGCNITKLNKIIECVKCKWTSCTKCTQTFITSNSNEAKCMNCNQPFDEDYLRSTFSKNWINKDYKKWKENSLIEREKGYLPETMNFISVEKRKDEIKMLIFQLKAKLISLKNDYNASTKTVKFFQRQTNAVKKDEIKKQEMQNECNKLIETNNNLKKNIKIIEEQIIVLQESIGIDRWRRYNNDTLFANYKIHTIEQILEFGKESALNDHDRDLAAVNVLLSNTKISEKKTFIKPCPAKDCRGFLSNKWICGLCNTVVCKDCHEIKGVKSKIDIIKEDEVENEVKNEVDSESKDENNDRFNHKCDQNNIETAKALDRETKGCPKCGTRIYKIDGCFDPNTEIVIFNEEKEKEVKEVKLAKNIIVGDKLIGDDGLVRNVIKTVNGKCEMYNIIQSNGLIYKVNKYHILALKHFENDGSIHPFNITVQLYIQLGKEQKNSLKGYRIDESGKEIYTTITVLKDEIGEYVGWETDGNHLFLLPDGTVVHNCDQMYCTNCHTPFSWKTGKIENGIIHNPHYFQYLRENNMEVPRFNHPDANPAFGEQMVCNGNPIYAHYVNHFNRNKTNITFLQKTNTDMFLRFISELIRLRNHLFANYTNNNNNNNNNNEVDVNLVYTPELNREIRIRYLNKLITDKQFKISIMKRYKKFECDKNITLIRRTAITVLDDFLKNMLVEVTNRSVSLTYFNPIIKFFNYYNSQTIKYSKLFGYKVCPSYIEIKYRDDYNHSDDIPSEYNLFTDFSTFTSNEITERKNHYSVDIDPVLVASSRIQKNRNDDEDENEAEIKDDEEDDEYLENE
jgi:hypothetical protein